MSGDGDGDGPCLDEPSPLTLSQLREKYADDESRFLDVDGSEIHYKVEQEGDGDEGRAVDRQVVLLLHASFLNLNTWDSLVGVLSPYFRVIRLDFPNCGLSGPDTKEPPGPDGKFDLMDRCVEVLKKFCDSLQLDKVYLVGTSTGGAVGFRFASLYPEFVKRMILINTAGMPRTPNTNPNRAHPELQKWNGMKNKEYYVVAASPNFPSLGEAPSWVVDLMYDINRCSDRTPITKYKFETGNVKAMLVKIQAPTLILWGIENPTVMHLEGDVISHWMTNAPTLLKKYDDLGHYLYIEEPGVVNADILSFLKGEMDEELRVTQRVKPEVFYKTQHP